MWIVSPQARLTVSHGDKIFLWRVPGECQLTGAVARSRAPSNGRTAEQFFFLWDRSIRTTTDEAPFARSYTIQYRIALVPVWELQFCHRPSRRHRPIQSIGIHRMGASRQFISTSQIRWTRSNERPRDGLVCKPLWNWYHVSALVNVLRQRRRFFADRDRGAHAGMLSSSW